LPGGLILLKRRFLLSAVTLHPVHAQDSGLNQSEDMMQSISLLIFINWHFINDVKSNSRCTELILNLIFRGIYMSWTDLVYNWIKQGCIQFESGLFTPEQTFCCELVQHK